MTTGDVRHPLDCKRGRPLSARNHEVGRLFARGLTEPEIAAKLVVSVNTVKYHVGRIKEHYEFCQRVSLHSHAALVVFLGRVYGGEE
jgi:DNA-binding NarL/FixJ family response regulator